MLLDHLVLGLLLDSLDRLHLLLLHEPDVLERFFFGQTGFGLIENQSGLDLLNQFLLRLVKLLLHLRVLQIELHVGGPQLLGDLQLREAVLGHTDGLVALGGHVFSDALLVLLDLVVFKECSPLVYVVRVDEHPDVAAIAGQCQLHFKEDIEGDQAAAVELDLGGQVLEVFLADVFFLRGESKLVLKDLVALVELKAVRVLKGLDVFVLAEVVAFGGGKEVVESHVVLEVQRVDHLGPLDQRDLLGHLLVGRLHRCKLELEFALHFGLVNQDVFDLLLCLLKRAVFRVSLLREHGVVFLHFARVDRVLDDHLH